MSLDLVLRVSSFALSLIGFVLALYVLVLNVWNTANRHLSLLFLVFALDTLFIGLILAPSVTRDDAIPLTYGLGATATPFQIALFLLTVVLLKPAWMRGRWRWLWWPLYALILLPGLLTFLDVNLGTRLWYTGLDAGYSGGFVELSEYAAGSLAVPIRMFSFAVVSLVSLLVALYVAWRDKRASPETRRLAWLLFGSQLVATVVQLGLRGMSGTLATLGASTVYVVLYGYASFQQMISERRLQRGRLQVRLVLLVLAIVVPMLLAISFLGSTLASNALDEVTDKQLALINNGLKSGVRTWLTLNIQTLQELVSLPDIISMDPDQQTPALQAVDVAHPQTYLVMTMDTSGMNVARNDEADLRSYSDRIYFTGAMSGRTTLQAIVSRTTGNPALAMGAPIRNSSGQIIGVGAIASELGEVSDQVSAGKVGETGQTFVVDEGNNIVAHSDRAVVTQPELVDATEFPPIVRLRQSGAGYLTFTDGQGIRWRAYVDQLENGWGVVVQQQESELQGGLQTFGSVSTVAILLGAVLMAAFLAFAMRQAFQPVNTLTSTAVAITAGDLTREAPVESEDELGALARAFNSMTAQLRDSIGTLEGRVARRTADLEQRSRYLQASADVGHAAASILDANQLVQQVVEVIRERFELYYVALFTVDESGEQAVLRAGTGEAGRARLARGFQLPLTGGSSMIAWCIINAQARIAQQAEKDEVRLVSPELPDTRSEVALPLRSRGQAIGALSLQSDHPNAFDEAALTVLQVMADQVAVALDNARLFAESESALEQAHQAYGELSQRAWAELLRAGQATGYRYEKRTVTPAEGEWRPEMLQAAQSGQSVVARGDEAVLAVPLKVRDQVIGVLNLRRALPDKVWTEEENALVESLAEQLGVALESARLYQDTQRRAAQEQLSAQVTARMRESLDVETVLKTAVNEMRQALGLESVAVQLARPETAGNTDESLAEEERGYV
ncbi:MAG: GAF domain-containing protein [Anaerolineae bacterium]|nr:GAF domain-containing protein [Anaerolineae bacterium]